MKTKRQDRILGLISEHVIETQDELIAKLVEEGYSVTQATISRDIKELRIIKELGPNGTYRYSSAPKQLEPTLTAKLNNIFKQSVIACDHAQNIVVIKTMPGLASAACSAIDAMNLEMIVGTLAGDDTAFLLMRDTSSAVSLCSDFKKQIN